MKRPNLAISGARERRRISDLPLCSISGLEIVWTAWNQLNDFRVLRDSRLKYKFLNLIINSVDTTKIPCYTEFFWYKPCTEVKKVVSASKHQYSGYKWVKGTYFCVRFCTASVFLSYDNFVIVASVCVTPVACTERGHARSRFFTMLACRETFGFFVYIPYSDIRQSIVATTSPIIPYLAEIIVNRRQGTRCQDSTRWNSLLVWQLCACDRKWTKSAPSRALDQE